MNPVFSEFKRKFSLSMYKDYKIALGEMTFYKDFVTDTKGDLYPVIEKSEDCADAVSGNAYKVTAGSVKRLICQFFPYATYELTAELGGGKVGFAWRLPSASAEITLSEDSLEFTCGDNTETVALGGRADGEFTIIVSCRPGYFDVYFKKNGKPEYFRTFTCESFKNSDLYSEFSDGYALLSACGGVTVKSVCSYLDSGVSIADMRPIKYENGEVLFENGKIYFSASLRLQAGCCQGVFSWMPGTAQFELTGAMFYDCGDGRWRGYVAPSILYHREKKEWYVWVSAFEHTHILAHGRFEGDPRFGINVIDVTSMPKAAEGEDIRNFVGFVRDEDPDFYYDEKIGKWRMAICRIDPRIEKYVYVFFESDEPFAGYKCIGKALDGCETGGSFVNVDGERFFVCGNDFERKSEYRIYSKDGMSIAKFNYPDGGFRGWGSIIPVKMCGRMRYFWLTFDRHKGSGYNWSYGNVYVFEAK